MNHEHDDFETLLTESLQIYANAQERPGLEERILARTISQSPAMPPLRAANPYRWGWLMAAAACAGLIAIAVYPHTKATPDLVSHNQPFTAPPVPLSTEARIPAIVKAHPHLSSHRIPAHPEIASLGPTSQERLLLQFVVTHRQQAASLADEQAHLDQPVKTTSIDIQPIQIQPIANKPLAIDPIQISQL